MQAQMTGKDLKHIYILLFVIPFLMGTAIDLYVPSLPAIKMYFKTSTSLVQYTISFYMFGYAIGQMFLGVMSDSFGRKNILLISGFIFTLVSFCAAFSPNIYFLIFYRFLQGVCIAGPAVVCRAIASDCYSGIALNKAMINISISWALGPILGPFIGGYLQHYFHWQANFYFFGIYALIVFGYSYFFLIETHIRRVPFKKEVIHATLKEIFSHPFFFIYSVISALLYSTLVVFNTIAPFLIQIDLKYSAIQYGHIALILGFGYFFGNIVNRFVVNYIKPNTIIILSLMGSVLISLIMIILAIYMKLNLYIILIPAIVIFFFCGLAFGNIMAKAISLFPHAGGSSNAILGSWVAGGVFVISTIGSFLPTNSQLPLAVLYFVIANICLVLFIIARRINNF